MRAARLKSGAGVLKSYDKVLVTAGREHFKEAYCSVDAWPPCLTRLTAVTLVGNAHPFDGECLTHDQNPQFKKMHVSRKLLCVVPM